MKALKDRLLFASPENSFFTNLADDLRRTFEVENANAPNMLVFLSQQWDPQILVVDADAPNFVNACASIRQKPTQAALGLIAVGRRSDLRAEETAFRAGFDHFLSLPVDSKQLFWRIQSLLRKKIQVPSQEGMTSLGEIRVYPKTFLVKRLDQPITVSPIQFRLLVTFLSHPDQLLTRDWLKTHVWSDAPISSRTIDAQISKLRRVIPELDSCLINIYGKGYVLTPSRQNAA